MNLTPTTARLALSLIAAFSLSACGGNTAQSTGNDAMMSSGASNDSMMSSETGAMTSDGAMASGDAMSSDNAMSTDDQMASDNAMEKGGNDAMAADEPKQ